MLRVAILDMPASGVLKVKVNDQPVRGYLARTSDNRFAIFPLGKSVAPLKTHPRSREAAGLLLAYYHFEMERKMLDEKQEQDELALAARAKALTETPPTPTRSKTKPRKEADVPTKRGAKQVRED